MRGRPPHRRPRPMLPDRNHVVEEALRKMIG
jgi:hypothetical protein